MQNSPSEKFKKLAEKRVNSVIKTLKLIGNLSNKSNYKYTDKDVQKIFSAITKELKICKARFSAGKEEETEFRLD